MDGQLARQPTRAQMEAEIARLKAWRQEERPSAKGYGGLCIAPYHNRHFTSLLADIGVPTREANPVTALFAPLRPPVYADLLPAPPPIRRARACVEPAGRRALRAA